MRSKHTTDKRPKIKQKEQQQQPTLISVTYSAFMLHQEYWNQFKLSNLFDDKFSMSISHKKKSLCTFIYVHKMIREFEKESRMFSRNSGQWNAMGNYPVAKEM